MIIELKANLKTNGDNLMRKGRYDDTEKPFPQEIYEEIDLDKNRKPMHKRNMIKVLSETPRPTPVEVDVEEETEDTDLIDPGTDDVETAPKKKVVRKARRTKAKK